MSNEELFSNHLSASPTSVGTENQTETQAASEQSSEPETQSEPDGPSELDMLKQRARLMGISFSNNIGVDTLRDKIRAKLNNEAEQPQPDHVEVDDAANLSDWRAEGGDNTVIPGGTISASDIQIGAVTAGALTQPSPVAATQDNGSQPPVQAKPKTLRQVLHEREMKLVRLRITNLDPKKKDLPGEIITFANEVLGAVRKFVPFGEATDNGYHVPYCIYKQLRDRKFLQIKVTKKNGREKIETGMVREFALEVLPPLTEVELARLAASQAAKAGE